MYTILVSPPGVAKKSTTVGYAESILHKVNEGIAITDSLYIHFGPTSGTAEGILKKMLEATDASVTVVAGEFGNLVASSPERTFDFFSKMFDNEATFEHSTRMHGNEKVINPSVNLIGCTTPDWMALNTGYITGGGFAARTVFVFEKSARQRKLFYDDVGDDFVKLEKVKEDLAHDLKIIGRLKGEFKPENKVLRDKIENWYLGYIDNIPEKGAETFHQRKHIHTLRTAMLLSLSKSNELVIRDNDFEAALGLIEDVERKLGRGLSVTSKNPYVQEHYKILDFIILHGPVSKNKVHAAFWQDIKDGNDFSNILEILKATGEIEEIDIGGSRQLRRVVKR